MQVHTDLVNLDRITLHIHHSVLVFTGQGVLVYNYPQFFETILYHLISLRETPSPGCFSIDKRSFT